MIKNPFRKVFSLKQFLKEGTCNLEKWAIICDGCDIHKDNNLIITDQGHFLSTNEWNTYWILWKLGLR